MPLMRHRSPVAVVGETTRPLPGRSRRGTWAGRLVQGALVVAAGAAALALAGPFALRPFADVAGAAGDVTVAFVLDFGGSPADTVVGCVTVPGTDSRYDALTAFTQSRGLALPTYAGSGLLCSIDGIPSSGCGQTVAAGYIYWSYFTGAPGGWTYSSTGAFGTVTPNDVEGWRFQDPGTGRPNDPPPRSSAQYKALCQGTSTTTTLPSVPPATSGSATGAGSGTAVGTGAGVGVGVGAAAAGRHGHDHRSARAARSGTHASMASASASGPTTTTASPPTSSPTSAPGPTTTTVPDVSVPTDPQVGVASVAHPATPAGAGPDPIAVGGLIVAILASAAWVRWRRRPRTP